MGAGNLDLVKDGKAVATIVIPDNEDAWTKMAAGWIAEYVKRATGADLPIVPESKAPRGALIAVGHTKLAEAAGIRTDDLKWDACKLVVKGEALYLLGRDTGTIPPNPKAAGESYDMHIMDRVGDIGAKGTCRAAATFLEDACGVRWLVPAPEGTWVPQRASLSVSRDLSKTVTPVFAYANGRNIYGSPLASPAAYANNWRTSILMMTYGGHSYDKWVPESLFKEHPEYFAMIAGKRTPTGNHLCTSNPEVRQLLLKGIQNLFDHGYDWVQLGQSDGYSRCECPVCESEDTYGTLRQQAGESDEEFYYKRFRDNPCERLLLAHKWIADECRKSHPDKVVHMLVYGPTIWPSKKFDRFGDNVVVEVTNSDRRVIDAWKDKVGGMTTYEYWLDETLGLGLGCHATPQDAAEIIRSFHDKGVIGMYTGGGGGSWGLQGPTYYVLGKMMGDPGLNEKELVGEYCEGLYGKAAPAMEQFFNVFYSRSDLKLSLGGQPVPERLLNLYPPRIVQQLDEILKNAEADADSERARQWVKLTRDEFDYVRTVVNALVAYRAYEALETPELAAIVKKRVEEFNAYRDRVLSYDVAYASRWFPGYGTLFKYLTCSGDTGVYYQLWEDWRAKVDVKKLAGKPVGYLSAGVSKPFTLNFSGSELEPTLIAVRAGKPPALDGVVDENAWKGAAPVHIAGVVGTQARIMYDDKRLYVAVECEEPFIDKLVVYDVPRDGPVYRMDCAELFLDPQSTAWSRRYYHIIVAPSKSALYDDRTGFKTATDQDETWNAEGLQYGYHVDQAGKRWSITMSIPFEALNARSPQPGTVWMGNVARERMACGYRQLMLWSQGGAGGFCDPASFGRIQFK